MRKRKRKVDMEGALFFSKEAPQITGYLVIAGIEYEIAGWPAGAIKSEIKARVRGPVQTEMFEDSNNEGDQRL
ncbi:hypothetical protein M2232_002328 [Bradyrhizobium japonicum]|uniref:hypothetical protein n=1 Tax=Bradyrhizobium japonicum TaxID=375 RepID=UPI002226A75C|nr:hypothetical protein [Bradyrhizobium japonicum]MCW2218796.1 hypothetical protein [Bradyrhizobium japonicum]MCW2343410.1 hypothetical protein [Bradyrhizobium japonicum]